MASFEQRVIDAVRRLQPGDVASYGEIAQEAGSPGAARAVGGVLARGSDLPWWRVVRADGRLVAPNERKQAQLLMKEGVQVVDGRVRPTT